jgi:hypothetical protein
MRAGATLTGPGDIARFRSWFAILTAVAVFLAARAAAAEPFVFAIPSGWLDLSPGAPPGNFALAPPAMVAEVKSKPFAAYAADVAHANDGFAENMNAIVNAGVMPLVTDAFVARAKAELIANMARQGVTVNVVEATATTLAGVLVARIVGDLQLGALRIRELQYLIPGDEQYAVLTYTATPETFAEYLPVFEAAATKTRGMRVLKEGLDWGQVGRSALMGGAIGGVVTLLVKLARARKGRRGATTKSAR